MTEEEKVKKAKKPAAKKKAVPKKKDTPKKKAAPKKEEAPPKEEEKATSKEEAPQEEAAVEEDVAEAEFEVITKSEDDEVFIAMDMADEEMVLAEIEGRTEALEHYVYSFQDRDGNLVTGLSLAGTREAARALALSSLTNPGQIQPTVPDPPIVIAETQEYIRVQATALDLRSGFRWHGFVEQDKYYIPRGGGEPVTRKFAFVIAMSKAQRNALRGLLPEHWIIQMIKKYVEQGKVKQLSEEKSPQEFTISKGKYKGSTIAEVHESDPEYLQWAVKTWDDRSGQLIQEFLNQLEADETPQVADDGATITYKGQKLSADNKITQNWFDGLRKLIKEADMHGSHLKNHLKKHYDVKTIAQLTFGQAVPFKQYLEERIAGTGGEEEEEPPETEEPDLDESEDFEPYAIPDDIQELASEIGLDGFDFEGFVVEHIAPHMEIDENVQKLLFKFLQRLSELSEDEDIEPLVKAFDKGIEQLSGEE